MRGLKDRQARAARRAAKGRHVGEALFPGDGGRNVGIGANAAALIAARKDLERVNASLATTKVGEKLQIGLRRTREVLRHKIAELEARR